MTAVQSMPSQMTTPPSSGGSMRSNFQMPIPRTASTESLNSLRVPDGVSFLEWVRSWDDDSVARWLSDHKCGTYAALFKDNDIRGDVILDVDQQALKEMNVTSVGDRIKIVVAIKKLRSACVAAGSRKAGLGSSLSHSPSASSLSGSQHGSTIKRTGSLKGAQRIPPPLHLNTASLHHHTNSSGSLALRPSPQPGSTGSLLSAQSNPSSGSLSPNVTIPNQHIRRSSSPRQTAGPPALPAPKGNLPEIPYMSRDRERSRTSGSQSQQAPVTTLMQTPRPSKYPPYTVNAQGVSVPALNVSKAGQLAQQHRKTGSLSNPPHTSKEVMTRPSTANSSSAYVHHQPIIQHPYATSSSPTMDSFDSIGPTSNRPLTSSKQANLGLAPITEAISPIPSPIAAEHLRNNHKEGFSVGKGGFARPTTPAGTVSATAAGIIGTPYSQPPTSMEDLLRRTVKFIAEEDGVSKLVNVDNVQDAHDILVRVLRKFGKLPNGSSQAQRIRDGEVIHTEIDGWAVFSVGADGNG